jgi:hypothetical protein
MYEPNFMKIDSGILLILRFITSTIWIAEVFVLLMGRIYDVYHAKFHYCQFRNPINLEDIASTASEALVFLLHMREIY